MDRNKKVTSIYLGVSILSFILMTVLVIYFRKSTGEKIFKNTGYAIGVFNNIGSAGRPSVSIAYFDFDVNGEYRSKMRSQGKFTYSKRPKKGDRYLVIYDTLDIENCQILFDYPIKDSTDFIRYLEEFKTKSLDFEKYF